MNYSFRSFQSQSDLSSRKLAKSCNIQDPFIFNSPLENIISIAFISQKSQDTRSVSFNPSPVLSKIIRRLEHLKQQRWKIHSSTKDKYVRLLSIGGGATSGARMISFPITDRSPGIIIFSSSRYGSRAQEEAGWSRVQTGEKETSTPRNCISRAGPSLSPSLREIYTSRQIENQRSARLNKISFKFIVTPGIYRDQTTPCHATPRHVG